MLIYIIYMYALFLIFLFVIGACVGSFLCCQVRRLHLHSTKHRIKSHRSVCLHCHTRLKWYDNLPIISWLILKGKCRKCHKPIGIAEFLSELILGIAFLLIGTTIDPFSASILNWCIFVVTLILVAALAFLAIYDGLYGELPTVCLIIAIAIAATLLLLKITLIITTSGFSPAVIIQPFFSVLLIAGIYFLLYKVSGGKWVGDGDWLLCVSLGLALADPFLALINLFFANFLAFLIMLPIVTKTSNHKIYFGPFLVIAFVITLAVAGFTPLLFNLGV